MSPRRRCSVCRGPLQQPARARERRYCSNACRQANYRRQHPKIKRWAKGLTVEELCARRQSPLEEMAEILSSWETAGIVECDDLGRWRLTAAGKPFGFAALDIRYLGDETGGEYRAGDERLRAA